MCTVENPVDLASGNEAMSDPQDELRRIFNLCDHQGQGFIRKEAFHDLGKSMFGGSEELSDPSAAPQRSFRNSFKVEIISQKSSHFFSFLFRYR